MYNIIFIEKHSKILFIIKVNRWTIKCILYFKKIEKAQEVLFL